MKIRSITCFDEPQLPLKSRQLQKLRDFIQRARGAFETAGYAVQTARLATVPLCTMLANPDEAAAVQLAATLERATLDLGYEYLFTCAYFSWLFPFSPVRRCQECQHWQMGRVANKHRRRPGV